MTRAPDVPDLLRLYEQIFSGSTEAIGVLGLDGRYLLQNEAHRRLLGYDDADVRGRTPAIHLGEEPFRQVARALAEHGVYQGELASRARDGTLLRIHLSAFTVRDAQGRPTAFVGIKRDLTLLKATQVELAGHVERLHALHALGLRVQAAQNEQTIYGAALDCLISAAHAARAAILLFDEDGVMRFRAWRGLSDAYRAAVEGHSPWPADAADPQPVVVHDGLAEPSLAPYHDLFRREGVRGLAFIPLVHQGRLLGKFMLYLDTPRGFRDADVHIAQTVASSVAFAIVRARSEQELRASRERMELAQAVAHVGHWDWDARRDDAQVSDELLRLCGRARGEMPPTLDGLLACTHLEDRPHLRAALTAALRSGEPFETTHRVVRPDGTVRWVRVRGTPHRRGGETVRILATVLDVTDIRQAERDRIESVRRGQELAALQAMNESKGRFISLAAHELRTPLGPMKAEIAMLKQDAHRLDAEQRESVEALEKNLRRMSRFVDDLMHVARMQTGRFRLERRPMDLRDVVEESLGSYRLAAAEAGVGLVAGSLPKAPIEGDPHRLGQVLANLLSNAIKVTSPGGRITVGMERARGRARVTVQDNGIGLRPQDQARLFEPFAQVHPATLQGTGLGLYICRSLVELHGGRIWCESDGPEKGARFTFELPLAGSRSARAGKPSSGASAQSSSSSGVPGSAAVPAHDHTAHLYEAEPAMVADLCGRALEALGRGHRVLILATRRRCGLLRDGLAGREALPAWEAAGDVRFLTAEEILPQILTEGRLDPDRFDAVLRGLLHTPAAAQRHVHVFGDLGNVLWRSGDEEGALLLEQAWERLRAALPLTLHCVYRQPGSAEHPDPHGRLRAVLDAHTGVLPAHGPATAGVRLKVARRAAPSARGAAAEAGADARPAPPDPPAAPRRP